PSSTDGSLRGTGSASFSGAVTAANSVNLALTTGASASDTLTVSNYTGGSGSTTHVSGSGAVILPAASTYAGGWAIDGGTLRVANAAALGTAASAVVVNSATTLEIASAVTLDRAITLNNGSTLLGRQTTTPNMRSDGTTNVSSGAAVTLSSGSASTSVFTLGDGTHDLTGGGV